LLPTRAVQRDRSKRPPTAPLAEQVSARLTEIVHPATLAQLDYYRQLGLRERILTLPVMVALALSLIWRQVGGVCELVRLAQSEKMLWPPPLKVSQPAFSERLGAFPAELFLRILTAVLPLMQRRWLDRQRPGRSEIAWAQARYPHVWVVDGSTLDALLRKVGLLEAAPANPLAGRMMALLELGSRLPCQLWYTPEPTTHDQGFWPEILAGVPAGALLIFDLGFTNFHVFQKLTTASVTFITRAKRNLVYQVSQTVHLTAQVHDRLVWIGKEATRQQVRLIEVLYRGAWYRYLTNELDPLVLPTEQAVALYRQRWRIEIVFPQMTKPGVFTAWAGWDYIMDPDLVIGDNHPINKQFDQLPLLLEGRVGQASLHTLTERLNRSGQTRQLGLTIHMPVELLLLGCQRLGFLLHLTAPPLVFG